MLVIILNHPLIVLRSVLFIDFRYVPPTGCLVKLATSPADFLQEVTFCKILYDDLSASRDLARRPGFLLER